VRSRQARIKPSDDSDAALGLKVGYGWFAEVVDPGRVRGARPGTRGRRTQSAKAVDQIREVERRWLRKALPEIDVLRVLFVNFASLGCSRTKGILAA
jgi:hypothetical protein